MNIYTYIHTSQYSMRRRRGMSPPKAQQIAYTRYRWMNLRATASSSGNS